MSELSGRTKIDVSVVIPVYNAFDFTRRCLESLYDSFGGRIRIEVIVVDNASFDETRSLENASFANLRYIRLPENRGFAAACNMGAEAAKGDCLFFLNNDTFVFPGSVEALYKCFGTDRSIGIAGSRLLFPDYSIQHAGLACNEELRFEHIFSGYPSEHPFVLEKRGLLAVTGASLMIRRSDFEEIGRFDEAYKNAYEDIDLCLRMRESGREVLYVPESVLIHYEGSSEGRKLKERAARKIFLERWRGKISPDLSDRTIGLARRLEMRLFAEIEASGGFRRYYKKDLSAKVSGGFENAVRRYLLVREARRALESTDELGRIRGSAAYRLADIIAFFPKKLKGISGRGDRITP
jgi:GT2 family glycosyltransferase